MILNTCCRTDILAYYSRWFYNRVKEGYVCTRNPHRPDQILKYRLDPKVADALCFLHQKSYANAAEACGD